MHPKPEYPRMQFRRTQSWLNLNGEWDFAFDYNGSAMSSGKWNNSKFYDKKIIVPFAPETKLSGIEDVDFHESVFYQRELQIPAEWEGQRILLHFGAVDFYAHVFIDDNRVFDHAGGSTSFEADITSFVTPGNTHKLIVHAEDFLRSGTQGNGKQSKRYHSEGCSYTRTTGIWQTVWLEAVPTQGLKNCRLITDIDNGTVTLVPTYYSTPVEKKLEISVKAEGDELVKKTVCCSSGAGVTIELLNPRLWSTIDPYLYDVELRMLDEAGAQYDYVETYFGMRKFDIRGNRFYLNNKPIYLRWVLDQGFYPDGGWTSPSDDALRRDITMSQAVGFNGARLHQKVFEERFHYWADKLGYITSAEYNSCGADWRMFETKYNLLNEWRRCVERDFSHPSIVMWTSLNESSGIGEDASDVSSFGWERNPVPYKDFVNQLGETIKAVDPTRPWHDASGYIHIDNPEIFSVHYYVPSAEELNALIHPNMGEPEKLGAQYSRSCPIEYKGQPYFVDEWGGFGYIPKADKFEGWGYGNLDIKTPEQFAKYIEEQAELMRLDECIAGHCFTQLTDVEQEQNGVYTYAREEKAPTEMLRAIFSKKPDWSEY